jgi:hypothetical protein
VRFDKDTRTKIQEAAPGSVTIKWPTGVAAPEKGAVYRMQSLEALREAKEKAAEPITCREVLADMHKRRYGHYPEGYKPKARKVRTTRAGDPFIKVLDFEILDRGFKATVSLYEDPDPRRHTGLKTKVAAGANPLDGFHEKVETEPEKIVTPPSRSEREDAETALEIEHKASVDNAEIARAARKLTNERRRGRRGTQAERALERARKRAELVSADVAA